MFAEIKPLELRIFRYAQTPQCIYDLQQYPADTKYIHTYCRNPDKLRQDQGWVSIEQAISA